MATHSLTRRPEEGRGKRGHVAAWRDGLLVFCASLALYVATAPRGVAPEDDGLFILASAFNGIAHPPGYPLFTLLGHLFSQLPIGSMAFRMHCLSSLFGAAAVLALWWAVRALPSIQRGAAVTAALAFACTRAFWSQAIIAEVYTLNAALVLTLFGLSFRLYRPHCLEQAARSLPLAAFLTGLSLANHWPLTVLAGSGLAILFLHRWTIWWPSLARSLPFFALGMTPYLWLYFRSQADPVISFYGPLNSFSDFAFYVTRQGYAEVDQSASAGLQDKLGYLQWLGRQPWQQFTLPGSALIVLGFAAQWKLWPKIVAGGLFVSFLCSSVLLALLLGFDYSRFWQAIFRVYPLIAYAICAMWLALGLSLICRRAAGSLSRPWQHRTLMISVAAALLLSQLAAHAPANDKRFYRFAERYARAALGSLPPDSILFLSDDRYFGPVAYMHMLQGVRTDIKIYNPHGLVLSNRLFNPLEINERDRQALLKDFINRRTHPVCVIGGGVDGFAMEENWLFQCVRRGFPEGDNTFRIHDEHLIFLRQLMAEDLSHDIWSGEMRGQLLETAGAVFTVAAYRAPQGDAAAPIRAALAAVIDNPHGRLGALKVTIEQLDPGLEQMRDFADTMLASFRGEPVWFATKADNALVPRLRARVALIDGHYGDAAHALRQSLNIWPSPDNPAGDELMRLLDAHPALHAQAY